jgi:hypothetical protein
MANEKMEIINKVESENKITITMSRKKNMGNYQSMDTSVYYTINIPEDASDAEVQAYIDKCRNIVSKSLADAEIENQKGF